MTLLKTLSITIIIATLSISNLHSQQWVTMMQDSTKNIEEVRTAFDAYFDGKEYEKGKGYKQFKRNEYFLKNRLNADGKFAPPVDRLADYKTIQKEINNQKSIGAAGKWVHLGPNGPTSGGGSGRINCIDFHPTNANIIIVGAPSGGIWRSTNGGSSWSTNSDDLASIGISDIKFAPSNGNIVYAATGDINGDDTYTHGILKSTNGGQTWSVTGWAYDYHTKKQTYQLLVHPTNPDIVYASTSLGFYKTTDGGQNWIRKRMGNYKDIAFKPGDPNTIYIATSSSIKKTTNGGNSFTSTSFSVSGSNRLEIETTAHNPDYLYVLSCKSTDGGFNGLFLSTNAGGSFTTKATSPNLLGWSSTGNDQGGQGWYDLSLEVSPVNKNLVYVGGINIWRSSNAGGSWQLKGYWRGQGSTYTHSDIHMLKFSPHSNTTIWACTDGGLSKSTNNGSSWAEKNNHLAVAQMYRMGASRNTASRIMTGWQDNGSSLLSSSWNKVMGGDGMECIVSHGNSNILYSSLYYGDIRRSYNGGSNWQKITDVIPEQGAWVTPYVMDYSNANILVAGYSNVWKSTNKGTGWTKISTWGSSYYKINAIATAGTNSSIIWAANSQGLRKTTNGGQSWTTITANIGTGSVNYIAIDRSNPNKVWVCKSGFYNGQKVYETSNGGTSWTNLSGSLPNYPVNTIVYAPNTNNGLYVGTDIGVYYRDNTLGNWVPFMKDLPNVIVKELEIYGKDHKIRAATFGRGLWESVLYPYANSSENIFNKSSKNIKIYPNPAKDVIYIKTNDSKNEKVHLTIYHSTGRLISEYDNLNKSIIEINTSKYSKGVYYFKITSDTYSSVHKVIIN